MPTFEKAAAHFSEAGIIFMIVSGRKDYAAAF